MRHKRIALLWTQGKIRSKDLVCSYWWAVAAIGHRFLTSDFQADLCLAGFSSWTKETCVPLLSKVIRPSSMRSIGRNTLAVTNYLLGKSLQTTLADQAKQQIWIGAYIFFTCSGFFQENISFLCHLSPLGSILWSDSTRLVSPLSSVDFS